MSEQKSIGLDREFLNLMDELSLDSWERGLLSEFFDARLAAAPAAPIVNDSKNCEKSKFRNLDAEHAKPKPVEQDVTLPGVFTTAEALFEAMGVNEPVAHANLAEGVSFEAWWAREVENNGGVNIGADYRHWAQQGYQAGQQAGVVDGEASCQ